MKNKAEEKAAGEDKQCSASLAAIEDSLYVIGGKWKLKVIMALREQGNMRFNLLQRTITGISARVLSNELKELEMNGFIKRKVYTTTPVIIEYELTGYSNTLQNVLHALVDWGTKHRNKIKTEARKRRLATLQKQ
jgi:DNA-binding HxlR family transcriptional regulator